MVKKHKNQHHYQIDGARNPSQQRFPEQKISQNSKTTKQKPRNQQCSWMSERIKMKTLKQ